VPANQQRRIQKEHDMRNDILRHLQTHAGQAWSIVCASLCDGLAPRDAERKLALVEPHVALRVARVDGELWTADGLRPMPLAEAPQPFYVDPATGRLRVNRAALVRRLKAKAARRWIRRVRHNET
jgi:hypothetical protein